MGLLSDNFLEISPGMQSAPRAASGSIVKSKEAFGFDEIADAVGAMLPDGQVALKNLNTDPRFPSHHARRSQRSAERKEPEESGSDAQHVERHARRIETAIEPNPEVAGRNARRRTAEDRRHSDQCVQGLTTKLDPLLDDLNKTIGTANNTLAHVDDTLGENRQDIRASVESLRQVLEKTTVLVGRLESTSSIRTRTISMKRSTTCASRPRISGSSRTR